WPGLNFWPVVGVVTVTTGGASCSMATVICAVPVSFELSVADAVIVCTPVERLLVLTVPPVPNWPSRLDVHLIAGVTTPSVPLSAFAANPIAVPALNFRLEAGAVIVTIGVGF